MDQIKTNEEIERNKTKRSTYFMRAVNCSCSKIIVMTKVIKMVLIITLIIVLITMIKIKINVKIFIQLIQLC